VSPSSNSDITVVISCFDYGRFLTEAIESALEQEGGPARVVVVDDASSDSETLEVLNRLPADVELVREEGLGVCHARNAGLARVQTNYAIVIDADDRLTPDALSAMRAPLAADPKLGFAYGRMRFFGDWQGELNFPPYDPYRLLFRHTIGLSALMRRRVIEDTGGFDPDFEYFEDWEFWLNALAHGWRGAQIETVTLEYRRHGQSKLAADRRRYRSAVRALRRKHAHLYETRKALAKESNLSPSGRLLYRFYWGPRPVPARVESLAHHLMWGGISNR
jgi:glycosyltransferase involved in cell wall biosynthesis